MVDITRSLMNISLKANAVLIVVYAILLTIAVLWFYAMGNWQMGTILLVTLILTGVLRLGLAFWYWEESKAHGIEPSP